MFKNLYILRHGPAGERDQFAKTGRPDRERPLTAKGRKEAQVVAEVLKSMLSDVDVILHSPYVRTTQTAQIVAKTFHKAPLLAMEQLRPMTPPARTWQALREYGEYDSILIVGHQPHLGRMLSFLLTSRAEAFDIKKTGLAWLEIETAGKKNAKAILKCLIQPSQIKKVRNRRKK